MTSTIQRLTRNGVNLGYEVRGGDKSKPPLLFAHGYALRATGDIYADLLDRLAERFSVYALDLRGHGASADALQGWSYEAIADDLAGFAPALGLDRPVFVGHSFGCVVGLLAEMRRPGAFEALCLLQPGPADSRRDPVDTLDALIEHGHDRKAIRDSFAQMFAGDPGSKLGPLLDAVVLVDASVHRAQKEQNPRFSIEDRLRDVTKHVLVVCGRNDRVIDPARQHAMAGKLPHSKEVIFSGQGHMLAIESSAAAAHEILAFVSHGIK